jgi:DNA-binding transcriptional regulator YiaG
MIYFARCGHDGPVKIGHTIGGISSRISYLQVGCPWQINVLGTMDGDFQTETELLKKFSHLNMRGEWFHASSELLDFIDRSATPAEKIATKREVVSLFTNASIDDEDWGAVITQIMRLNGWRQVDMADALGMHQAMISKWTRGKHGPGRAARIILRSLLESAQKQVAA